MIEVGSVELESEIQRKLLFVESISDAVPMIDCIQG
jgi:hypothetical protein